MAKKVVEKTVAVKSKPDQATLDAAMALFNSAPKIPVASPKGKATKVREIIELGEDLDQLAAMKLLADVLTETAEVVSTSLKNKVREEYARKMVKTGVRPDTFIANGPRSEAYCELRKRSTNSALPSDAVAELDSLGIPYGKEEQVPDRFVINPGVIANQDHLKALAEAVKGAKGLEGINVVLRQDAQFKYVASDETLPAVARYVNSEQDLQHAVDLLGQVATISVGKFKIDGLKESSELIKAALQIISGAKLLGVEVKTK